MTNKQVTRYSFTLIFIILGVMSVQSNGHETLAQLEIPEAKPVESNGANSINASETSNYLVFDDPAPGYSISYPNDWEVAAPGVEFGLSAFRAPDGSSITVKFIPTDDFNSDNIEELLEQAQEDSPQNVFTRNSTTTLGGLPAYIEEGIFTFTPNVFETLAGELGYTNRIYMIWGHSENKDGFYGIIFSAASKPQYDEGLPIAKNIIDSFTVEETSEIVQEDAKEDSGEDEPDDTFVGSAGNNDETNEEEQEGE